MPKLLMSLWHLKNKHGKIGIIFRYRNGGLIIAMFLPMIQRIMDTGKETGGGGQPE